MLRNQFNILVAMMLRNMRTRFFGTGLGFLISIGWPLAHVGLLLLFNAVIDRAAPYGESLVLFFVTGLVPFMAFNYMARFIMISVIHTRPLLAFPAVKITDLLFGGACLEVFASCWSIAILALILTAFGIDILPHNPAQAAYAMGSSFLLGFGYGVISGLIGLAFPMWITGSTLAAIVLYLMSGIFYVVDTQPAIVRYYLSFNPLLQDIQWMRSAYYDGYGPELDKVYAVSCAVVLLFASLVIERLFRGRFLIMR